MLRLPALDIDAPQILIILVRDKREHEMVLMGLTDLGILDRAGQYMETIRVQMLYAN